MDRYQHRRHNKNLLMVHLILVTKYRKPLLTGYFRKTVLAALYDVCIHNHWYILRMETDQDHVHILLQYNPADSITHIVSMLKQLSTWKYMESLGVLCKLLKCPLLERAYFMVRWLFCRFYWSSVTKHNRTLYRESRIS